MSPRSTRRASTGALVTVVLIGLVGLVGLAGCSDDSDGLNHPDGGGATAREVVDLHLAASRVYDLAGTCELLTPKKRAEMAAYDGKEVEGYCQEATADVVASATDAVKARNKAIYTGAVVSELDQPSGTWFRVEAADGSYGENVETVEVDGRWWIAQVLSDIDVAGDEGH